MLDLRTAWAKSAESMSDFFEKDLFRGKEAGYAAILMLLAVEILFPLVLIITHDSPSSDPFKYLLFGVFLSLTFGMQLGAVLKTLGVVDTLTASKVAFVATMSLYVIVVFVRLGAVFIGYPLDRHEYLLIFAFFVGVLRAYKASRAKSNGKQPITS